MTKLAIIALAALFLINIYAGLLNGWGDNPYVSMAFHFLGGFFVTMLLFSSYNTEFAKLSQPFRLFSAVAITIAIGVAWEFVEFVSNRLLTQPVYAAYQYHVYFMGDLNDTIQDLLMDTLGAIGFLAIRFGRKL